MSMPQQPVIQQEPRRSSPCGVITVILVVAVLLVVVFFVYRCNRMVDKLNQPETQAIIDASMMLALADENIIRESAVEVTPEQLTADPMKYHQRWVKLSSTIEWLQSTEGRHLSHNQAQQAGDCSYWVSGPLVIMDMADTKQIYAPGDSITAWGRTVVTTGGRFKHDQASQQALNAMSGYNPQQVIVLVAKWTESP